MLKKWKPRVGAFILSLRENMGVGLVFPILTFPIFLSFKLLKINSQMLIKDSNLLVAIVFIFVCDS